jgi:hypothetical protein
MVHSFVPMDHGPWERTNRTREEEEGSWGPWGVKTRETGGAQALKRVDGAGAAVPRHALRAKKMSARPRRRKSAHAPL